MNYQAASDKRRPILTPPIHKTPHSVKDVGFLMLVLHWDLPYQRVKTICSEILCNSIILLGKVKKVRIL